MSAHKKQHVVTDTTDHTGSTNIVDAGKVLTTDGLGGLAWSSNGSGTVTSASIIANQGVSGSIANATTTPAITLTLGALTAVSSFNGLIITPNTGVITTGAWNGTVIGSIYGGTGQTTVAIGDLLYGSASNVWSKRTIGSSGQVLTVVAGLPAWQTPSGGADVWELGTGTLSVQTIGTGADAQGEDSVAEGSSTVGKSYAGHVEGNATTASGVAGVILKNKSITTPTPSGFITTSIYSIEPDPTSTFFNNVIWLIGDVAALWNDYCATVGAGGDLTVNLTGGPDPDESFVISGGGSYIFFDAGSNATILGNSGDIPPIYTGHTTMSFSYNVVLITGDVAATWNSYCTTAGVAGNLTVSLTGGPDPDESFVISNGFITYDAVVNKTLLGNSTYTSPTYTGHTTMGFTGLVNVPFTFGIANHAEGDSTIAFGNASHAEGKTTTSKGNNSHAEGLNTTAVGENSHAEGSGTTAIGTPSHTEGTTTIAISNNSHAEGLSTTAIGGNSHSEGYNTNAKGENSHAEGYETTASGVFASHSEGFQTKAIGRAAHAEGGNSTAIGDNSHAEGVFTTAISNVCHTEGSGTTAGVSALVGNNAHAEGYKSTASGAGSHAEGGRLSLFPSFPAANGGFTVGEASHAEGSQTTAVGIAAHAEGHLTIAIGENSHAGGLSAQAEGIDSFNHSKAASLGASNSLGEDSAILGGVDNNTTALALRSVVLGGSSRTESKPDYVNVPNFRLIAPEYADNAAAVVGGLTSGAVYATTVGTDRILKIVI